VVLIWDDHLFFVHRFKRFWRNDLFFPGGIPMSDAHLIQSDQEALEVAERFAQQIESGSADRDRNRRLPFQEIESFSESGLWGITVPKQFGGAGVSTETFAKVIALVSAADASIGQIPQNHYANIEEIRLVGTKAQKVFFFGRILKGERLGNAAVERSGKTVVDNQTRLVPDGSGYLLNGEKFYCTGALYAHWVPVRVTDSNGKRVVAIVSRQSEGLTVMDDWSSFGQRTTASGTVTLHNVRVTEDQIIRSFQAYDQPTTRGPFSQIIHVAIDIGIAQAAIKDTIHFLRGRFDSVPDGKIEFPAEDPLAIYEVSELQCRLHAAEALMERAARAIDRAVAAPDQASVSSSAVAVAEAKVVATEVVISATNQLFELAGPESARQKHGLDRHWRNARVHTLHDPVRWKYYAVGNYYLNNVDPPRHAWL
jgi:SfnB family sulfur acquisition oxidoreductase